jgi:hypothetical protein
MSKIFSMLTIPQINATRKTLNFSPSSLHFALLLPLLFILLPLSSSSELRLAFEAGTRVEFNCSSSDKPAIWTKIVSNPRCRFQYQADDLWG